MSVADGQEITPLKCPGCNSRVDHSNLVNVNGDRHFVCSHCRRQLVHRMGIGKVFLLAVVAVPFSWFLLNALLTELIGPALDDTMVIGFAAVDAITFVLSVVAVALLLQHSMRLIERRSDGHRPY